MKKWLSDMYFLGRKCIFCNKYGLYKLADKRVKCKHCNKKYSIQKVRKDLQILYYFYLEISARKAANELEINYNVVHRKFMYFRKCIAEYCNNEARKLYGELELDESYFGGKRKGKRGRGANNKAIVFGILERKGRVHTVIVRDVSADTLMNEIKNKTKKGSVFFTDTWKSYNSLKQYGKHNKINHQEEFAKKHNHINGIEGFWSFAKERFHKYHGISKTNYPLYIKEMEFRFNHRNESIYKLLIDICIVRGVV
ncbi:MAG TPA: IS1595 family transposase [Candidatus Nanoarchaeia archaeon]|nr:IS1595 family transposase [Candidatus Nanoarchaeia archaeon]